MAVRLVINMHSKPGMARQFAEAWSPHYDEVNAEDGCIQYELFTSTRNPDNLAMVEHWADRDAFEKHWALELSRGPQPTAPFSGDWAVREVGRAGLEIYYDLQYYRWDGTVWAPTEY